MAGKTKHPTTAECMAAAWKAGIAIPAFNIPHLPMMEPIVRAIADQNSFALIEVARLEFIKFKAGSARQVYEEYDRLRDPAHIRLHLDHVPVIDEDGLRVDYLGVIGEALELGYESVMVDGSRLSLEENIRATRAVAELAHAAGVPCEAELGAVMGHESGPAPSYEEIFASRRGFTRPEEASRFVRETGCDWLSVAIGNIHGAISGALKDQKKVEARLDIDHLRKLREACGIPLVLHGGSGVRHESVLQAIPAGIAKVNVGTELRQAYETALKQTTVVGTAQQAAYARTTELLRDYFRISGSASVVRAAR
jgi:fructose-bisphosphate aldolase class II